MMAELVWRQTDVPIWGTLARLHADLRILANRFGCIEHAYIRALKWLYAGDYEDEPSNLISEEGPVGSKVSPQSHS